TPAWTRLQEMAEQHSNLIPVVLAGAEPADVFDRLDQGEIDLAVVDSTMADDVTSTHPDLTVAFTLPGSKSRTWATADADLLRSLNQYLNEAALTREINTVRFEDLQAITQRKELRVITYQSPANYYLDEQGELRGFEYELVKRFAKKAGLRLDVLVAPTRQDMIDWLLEGRGDLIAASMPASAVRKDARLNLSRPYNYAAPLIIGRSDEAALIDARDLEGRRIMVPAGSPHKQLLERYRDQGIAVEIVEADPALGIDQILFRVARGMFDLTVVDSHKAKALLAAQPYAQAHFAVSEPLPHVWIMRGASQQLQAAVNDFIDKTYRSREYNILHAKYFEHARDFEAIADKKTPELLALGGELSPYDALIRDYAERFGFDWRLIVAQIYQESRFDPQAVSEAGAEGLMQLLPSTAVEVGLTNVMDPETGIHAGLQYLRKLHDRLEEDLTLEDRIWFSLAAYNAGYGRLQMARQLATEMGLDPHRWFGNVEKAMLKLADHTTCQCGQPVAYVREIRNRYHTYVRLTQATQLADARTARWPGREG
ncbi:MAG: transporter substrate-binding domain-containing protein, partial [Gammaproteobacteria bacterium]